MNPADFVARVSEPEGLRELARRLLAAQVENLGRNRCRLVLPLTRRPFEAYGPLHFHQGFELVLQCRGVSRWELLEGHVEAPEGSLLLIPRGVPHVERVGPGAACDCNVNLYVSQDLLTYHGFAWILPDSRRMLSQSHFVVPGLRLIFDLLAEAVAAFERGGPGSPLVRGLLLSATALLLEGFSASEARTEPGTRLVSLCRQEALRYLCSASLNVAWLAEQLGCNADYLSHLFRRRTGQRLNAFINEERVKLGRYLLESSTLSIGEVASSCGYADPDYFARVFRRSAGKSPHAFRAAARHAAAVPEVRTTTG